MGTHTSRPARTPARSERTSELATLSEFDGVRYLHLGGTPWVQGAMRLRAPNRIELEYVRRMMAWMLLREPAQLARGHAVQFGLGAGAITRFCHRTMGLRCTVVELNAHVVRACRAWFRLPSEDDERLRVTIADAGAWAADPAHAGSADVLCIDLYDHEAAAPVLDSAGFYADCHRLLAEGGVMAVNLFGRRASFERSLARIVEAFGIEHVATMQATREGNSIVLAWRGGPLPDGAELARRAANIDTRFGLPAAEWIHMLRGAGQAPRPRQAARATAAARSTEGS
jgi:spermidine synthase